MSIQAIAAAFRVEAPSPVAKFVLLALADHARADGTNIYPSRESLALKTQFCKRTITRGLSELLDAGLIIITRYGNGTPNTYAMPLNAPVYVSGSNQGHTVQPRHRVTPRQIGKRKGPEDGLTVHGVGHTVHTPWTDSPPNRNDNLKLTGEDADFIETEEVYRPLSMQVHKTELPVLRIHLDENSEWLWPLEIFDDTKPFRDDPQYLGWTERQLRAECQSIPCGFDIYCWRIETGRVKPGQTEGYVPLKGDIGGDE